jgi:hypothetical protein
MKKIKYVSAFIIVLVLFGNVSNAQMKRFDSFFGLSGGLEIDNQVTVFAANYEIELFNFGPGLAAAGGSLQYRNQGSTPSGNTFIIAEVIYNFSKISKGKFIPFLSAAGGTSFEFNEAYYSGQAGFRYFIDEKNSLAVKYGAGKRSKSTIELCFDVKL